ncbi:energy-coupling factor transporter transmembrane component T family protein [Bifidobacterium choloepi]|uniref:Energy-coupling factor transporter transmembrane protein EcfT n=1 Tax=Bifidobacterium choloepi TaxID=2614131 RepID=A0A6I5MZT5_9BIFI|nr:energy-coupling factor transporter transmembrane component T [Bifidobacterium choloepi]NEG70178.1 energy-coupling factor transporter transmembrane protein EcfT [Bifidobacterium choloepi]
MNAEFYVRGHGWLHRMDPRVKCFIVLATAVMSCVWGNLIFLAAVLVLLHLFLLLDHTPAGRVGHLWRWLLPVDIVVFAVIVLAWRVADGTVLWDLDWVKLTAESLTVAGVVVLRISNIVVAWFLMLFTTSRTQWINGLARFGVPFRGGVAWTRFLNYLPQYFAVKREIVAAEQTRGLTGGFWSGSAISASANARIDRRTARVDRAMRERGAGMTLDGKRRRTQYLPVRMRGVDWFELFVALLVLAAVIVMICLGW